jgi:hypothetical protein
MDEILKGIMKQMGKIPYPRFIIMQKEAAEELFQKEFQHIPDHEAGLFKIHKNGKVTGKMIKV